MPHLARPTSSIRGNRSTGVQRFVAWPQHIAVSLRLTDQATSIDRERVSTARVSGWAKAATVFLLTPDFFALIPVSLAA